VARATGGLGGFRIATVPVGRSNVFDRYDVSSHHPADGMRSRGVVDRNAEGYCWVAMRCRGLLKGWDGWTEQNWTGHEAGGVLDRNILW